MTVDSCWTERLSTSDLAVATQAVGWVPPVPLSGVPPPPLVAVPLPVPPVLPELAVEPEPPVATPPGLSPLSRRVQDDATTTRLRATKGTHARRYRLRRV